MTHDSNVVRTPSGIRLGDRVNVNGRKGLRVSHKGREDVLLPEELIESITGLPVEKIIFRNQPGGRSSPGA